MSFIETRCRLCTKEIRTKSASFHDTDVDHLKYKYKLKILFEDLVLEEDDTTPFVLCLFCVEKIRNTFEFRKQCLNAYQFWGIQFGRDQSKSIESNFKIIPSVDSHFTRYEFVPTTKEPPAVNPIKMEEESPVINEIKKEIQDPVPLVGNMKNKLSSLLKLSPLEPKASAESPEAASILSLTLLRRKRTYKKKTPEKPKNIKEVEDDVVNKPILNIDKLKQNLNKRINFAASVDVKMEADDDDDVPLKTLKRKLNDIKNMATVAPPPLPLTNPLMKLNIFNLKNKLGTALKIGESLTENQKKVRRPKKHGLIVDINHIIADKKNNIFYCKYCFKYFQNVAALRYHVVQHAKSRTKKIQISAEKMEVPEKKEKAKKKEQEQEEEEQKEKKKTKTTTQCDICQKWYVNLQVHKARAHFKNSNNKKTENHKK